MKAEKNPSNIDNLEPPSVKQQRIPARINLYKEEDSVIPIQT